MAAATSTEIQIVRPDQRVTHDYMSSFEYCEVVSIRARQIEHGSPTFVQCMEADDPIAVAKREIAEKKCPLKIRRMLTPTLAEEWDVNELHSKYETYAHGDADGEESKQSKRDKDV